MATRDGTSVDPFQLHTLEKLGDVRRLADWLLTLAREEQPVALALKPRQKKMAFSTRDDAWVIDLKHELAPLALDVVKTRLMEGKLPLLLRNAARDLSELITFIEPEDTHTAFKAIAPTVIGDLVGTAYVINQIVTPSSKFKRIEHDAYEIALIQPQYAEGIPNYYHRVSLPNAKIQSEMFLFKDKGAAQWMVEYEDLWIKVLAHYTQDPTLTHAIWEGTDPRSVMARIFQISPAEGEMYLLYAACGWSTEVVRKYFPGTEKELPQDLAQVQALIGRKLPNLAAGVNALGNNYINDRVASTMYGRRLRPGQSGATSVAFRIFGSVDDIVGVAAATFWTNRAADDTMIIGVDALANKTWRILGRGPTQYAERVSWLIQLKELAPLLNPLGSSLPLRPRVVELPSP